MLQDDKPGKTAGRWRIQRADGSKMAKGQALVRAPLILPGKGNDKGLMPLVVLMGCKTGWDEGTETEGIRLRRGRYIKDKGTETQPEGDGGLRVKRW
mgnify:CR=1 FL=1